MTDLHDKATDLMISSGVDTTQSQTVVVLQASTSVCLLIECQTYASPSGICASKERKRETELAYS